MSVWDPVAFSRNIILYGEHYVIVEGRWLQNSFVCFMVNVYGPQDFSVKSKKGEYSTPSTRSKIIVTTTLQYEEISTRSKKILVLEKVTGTIFTKQTLTKYSTPYTTTVTTSDMILYSFVRTQILSQLIVTSWSSSKNINLPNNVTIFLNELDPQATRGSPLISNQTIHSLIKTFLKASLISFNNPFRVILFWNAQHAPTFGNLIHTYTPPTCLMVSLVNPSLEHILCIFCITDTSL